MTVLRLQGFRFHVLFAVTALWVVGCARTSMDTDVTPSTVDTALPLDSGLGEDAGLFQDSGVTGDSGIPTDSGTPLPDGGTACTAEQALCGDQCVDLASNPTNCGGCGVVCGLVPHALKFNLE